MTAQRTRARHSDVRLRIQRVAPAALRPATMSNNLARRASTMVVPQCFRR
ncbi:hypothetical protein [Candidatus Poriferisodalis sp.]